MEKENKKSFVEKLTDFAHQNPFCFIVGTVVAGEVVNNTYHFILGLFGKDKRK